MGTRRKGRIIAFQTLYRFECTGESLEDVLDFSWIDKELYSKLGDDSLDFARLLITGTTGNLQQVDESIKRQLEHWDFSRIARVDLAILRVGVYCLLFQKDIPFTVTIDEAISISKEYGTEDSYRFINGILDSILKKKKDSTI